jgi:hypothetical protein
MNVTTDLAWERLFVWLWKELENSEFIDLPLGNILVSAV